MRRGRRRGSPVAGVGEDGVGAIPERVSARGSVEAKQWTMVELVGTARRRVDGGGCGLHDGAGTAASAMASRERGREHGGV